MGTRPILYYIHDPMCSWCWGFKSGWDAMRERLSDRVEIRYVVGGLAPECHEPMPMEMREMLEQTWQRVSEKTGASFNHDFWRNNTPMRSTYPACKAVLLARDQGKELEMIAAIQALYYQQAGNPSEYETLYKLASGLGMDMEAFKLSMHAETTEQRLREEIMFAESLGAQGFPSLVLEKDGEQIFIQHSYTDVEENLRRITSYL
ncbi:MAG: DsbA family protein [Gammaproteobacteria bacterium]|nr:DsbA family protein [Gammaproteobacteria bacterium]